MNRATRAFLPGLELARRYYVEVVGPLLDRFAPGLEHSAGLIGWGSDVLGFDSARSTDHNWGPRCLVFVGTGDAARTGELTGRLDAELPETFLGWPARFPDVTAPGTPVRHWVEIAELGDWLTGHLGFDPRAGVGLADWLATSTQLLAEVTGGAVFHDGLGGLDAMKAGRPGGLRYVRAKLEWYPEDVWRYVLACQWQRINQEEAFPGRCAEAGDELGSVIVSARLARDVLRLAMLTQRRYPPYSKWLGTAAARLPALAVITQRLRAALMAQAWPDREREFSSALSELGRIHNGLALTEPVDVTIRPYFDRPYSVIDAGRLKNALRDSITDDQVRRLPLIGAVDQFVDSTDALSDLAFRRAAVAALING